MEIFIPRRNGAKDGMKKFTTRVRITFGGGCGVSPRAALLVVATNDARNPLVTQGETAFPTCFAILRVTSGLNYPFVIANTSAVIARRHYRTLTEFGPLETGEAGSKRWGTVS